MDPNASFFWTILALQLVFSVAVVWLVARRWPQRARIYRIAAPAALPLLMVTLLTYGYSEVQQMRGLPVEARVIGSFMLAYGVLWLVGILAASLVLRRFRR